MNIKKRIATMGVTMIMAASILSIDAHAASVPYQLHYTAGAPSTINVTSCIITKPSSGASQITVKSTYFSTYISGAYCKVYGYNLSKKKATTNVATVNDTNSYTLNYKGKYQPKRNVNVTVKAKLARHNASRSVAANGIITF